MEKLEFIVGEEFDGERILNFLRKGAALSATLVKRAKVGGVFVDGENVHMRHVLKAGQTVTVSLEEKIESDLKPYEMPLDIVYEDEWLIAVNKPTNMPTHPSRGNSLPTLAEGLRAYLGEGFVFRAVNRLDRDTSGIVIVAKNQHSSGKLCESMKAGGFSKKYTAIVTGILDECGRIDAPIERESEGNMKRCVRESGKRALTDYSLIRTNGTLSLCELTLHTGRTHQIRVHMAYIGHPLYNDFLYGERVREGSYYLHAGEISFPHPEDNRIITLKKAPDFDLDDI